jgi:membrane protein DedA with SNARE-associated domain
MEERPVVAYGLPVIALMLLAKEAGIPIPIPGDVLMLGVAARAASGQWNLLAVIVACEGAMLVGGTIQYLLARGPGRRLITRAGRYVGLTPGRLERVAGTLRRGGGLAVAAGLVTPGVRAATIAASGLSDLPFRTFFPALVAGDTVFFLLHVAIGYAGGQGLAAVSHGRHLATGAVLLIVLGVLALLGLGVWLALRWRAGRRDRTPGSLAEAAGGWEEAACPLCLALETARARGMTARLAALLRRSTAGAAQ